MCTEGREWFRAWWRRRSRGTCAATMGRGGRCGGEVPAGGRAQVHRRGGAGVDGTGRLAAGYFTRRLAEEWLDAVLVGLGPAHCRARFVLARRSPTRAPSACASWRSIAGASRRRWALAAQARAKARGRGARARLAAAARLEQAADRAERVHRQIARRLAGEKIGDRLVSLADPDARPIGKGELGKRYEFGYVFQLAELTPHTRRGARGLILPAASAIGAPNESELLPATASELDRLQLRPREIALDGGFPVDSASQACPDSSVFIAGRQQPASRRSSKRLAGYRVGCEGRISHLKRGYGLRRSRLKGHRGARTWVGWAILAYNVDTLAIRSA
jgi:IS5 family transposase